MTTFEKTISIYDNVGSFAEDKDKARNLRLNEIMPAIEQGQTVVIDFARVHSATQSFIHALISDVIRKKGVQSLNQLLFKNCNSVVRTIIETVVDYMQEHEKTEDQAPDNGSTR